MCAVDFVVFVVVSHYSLPYSLYLFFSPTSGALTMVLIENSIPAFQGSEESTGLVFLLIFLVCCHVYYVSREFL